MLKCSKKLSNKLEIKADKTSAPEVQKDSILFLKNIKKLRKRVFAREILIGSRSERRN